MPQKNEPGCCQYAIMPQITQTLVIIQQLFWFHREEPEEEEEDHLQRLSLL